ncbi:Cysteine-rich/transmembrane domain A-like protein [Quillaja saponaria]|uniref:Cysteine-rich/transmembrane domain A-like protein n=1 Tax=Quillaja saponaria TaxID=32244 RepID=A0AAD7QCB6_QUISA|nr:Cysteine-rich/transmembrane domain A-like protein [Quillaja saponaria]
MSNYDQTPPQGSYSSTNTTAIPNPHPVPPPAVTPFQGGDPQTELPSGETKSKGDGFWRGCCAGWCCYCCLDMCF